MVSQADVETALKITPRFYEAVVNSDLWPAVLQDLCEIFGARIAQLNVFEPKAFNVILTHQIGIEPAMLERWLSFEDHLGGDPRTREIAQQPNRPMHCRQLVSDAEWHASSMYRQICAPSEVEYTLGINLLFEEANLGVVLGVMRSRDMGIWTDDDVAKFQLYVPHLRQAVKIFGHLYNETGLAKALKSAFDKVKLATIIVDRHCRIQHANASAHRLIEAGNAIRSVEGKVLPVDSGVAREFRQSVFDCVAKDVNESSDNAFHIVVPSTDGNTGLYATIAPVAGNDDVVEPALRDTLFAAVFLNDPAARYETDEEQLMRFFGLTETEAEVMRAYGEGTSVADIASETGRSLETVRTHLKSVRDKTGARSQVKIGHLISGLSK